MYRIPLVERFGNNAPALLDVLANEQEDYWVRRGQQQALALFHAMAERVPAYGDFLKKNGVKDHNAITSPGDFTRLPIASKDNYLLQYPRAQLCWDGKWAEQQWVVSSTSGSTGKPFYFPRTPLQDRQFALTAELCLRDYFGIHRQSTLFINCFALGVWIGGMFVYQAVKYIVDSGTYALAMITPGADKAEALKAVRNLAPEFDQVVIGGYGPLVKDLIDEGMAQGMDWSQYRVKYLFAAEAFTEGFRDYLVRCGGATDLYGGTLNIYGTADLGAMAHETPLSILVRRLVAEQPHLHEKVFAYPHKLPTFTQYIPELYFFEEVDGRLVCSSPGGLPLVRYDLKDRGEVWGCNALRTRLLENGFDMTGELKRRNIAHSAWNLPFVSVYERNDFTVSIYSVNIYPETVRKALEDAQLQKFLTGKFTMAVEFDAEQNQVLWVHVEMLPGVSKSPSYEKQVLASVVSWLSKENSEWRDFYAQESIRGKVTPHIVFWPYQDQTYFKPGGKQKWVKKT